MMFFQGTFFIIGPITSQNDNPPTKTFEKINKGNALILLQSAFESRGAAITSRRLVGRRIGKYIDI